MHIVTRLLVSTAVSFSALVNSVGASPWGICAHLGSPREGGNLDTALRRVNDANITWMRADLQFSRIMRHGLDKPDFTDNDHLLDELDAANVRVFGVLQGFDWEVERYRPEVVPLYAHPEAWRTFVRAVANHYKGRITHYSVWNEQNGGFWKPHPDAAQYVTLLKIAYAEIKAIDPQATVMVGGLAYWDTSYLRDMYAAGAKGYYDIIAVHPYGEGLDQNPRMEKQMIEFKNAMVEHGDQKTPIWITECGGTSNEPTILYRNNLLIPSAIRYALTKLGQKSLRSEKTKTDFPTIGIALSPRTKVNPNELDSRSWLPNIQIKPITPEQLISLDPQSVPVLIGTERLHVDQPLLQPFQNYVDRGGLLILAGQIPLYGVYQQRLDGTWTPGIDQPKETQKPFRLSFSAWWKDKAIPHPGTTRVKTTEDALAGGIPLIERCYVDRVLRSDNIKPGDSYYPIITAYNNNGTAIGDAMALYTYQDKKGGVLAICTPAGGQLTEAAQAAMLPRVYLTYLSADMRIEKLFWYDLHNDGPSPYEAEHNFGLLSWDWSPKPAWYSYHAMTTALGSSPVFVRRIQAKGALAGSAWALLFRRSEDNQYVLAAWTIDSAAPFSLYTTDNPDAIADIINDSVRYFPVAAEEIHSLRITN